jgi:serine/threonine-protein kinase haspin
MSKPSTVRKYGKQSKKAKCDRLFAELPQTPARQAVAAAAATATEKYGKHCGDAVKALAKEFDRINLRDENGVQPPPEKATKKSPVRRKRRPKTPEPPQEPTSEPDEPSIEQEPELEPELEEEQESQEEQQQSSDAPKELASDVLEDGLRVLSWAEVCPPGDQITKIAEASYAEVYRVSNERGISIIKVIRMESPIRAQTKAQEKSGLVDEEPHPETDLLGELCISEWLADIPGFVMYKERYMVRGKACRELLETHQVFHRRVKRKDPSRLQFYPSPSRYLDDTKFLVVELADAGTALEDFQLKSADQLWDIFFHVAIALARAEGQIEFEVCVIGTYTGVYISTESRILTRKQHRDLHEGNLCIRQVGEPVLLEDRRTDAYFGHSGLEITILDYGLSRARGDLEKEDSEPVAYDLERDLSIFTSEHAPQCKVYRQMRSFLLRGERAWLPPQSHNVAYAEGVDGPISWGLHEPYTNVLWLAYIYDYLVNHFAGPKKEVNAFQRTTMEFWPHLDPEADEDIPSFASASDIVVYAVESGWIDESQLMDGSRSMIERSILSVLTAHDELAPEFGGPDVDSPSVRRSPRRHRQRYIV